MNIFEQMVYHVRNIQILDTFLKFHLKKFDYIPEMNLKDGKLELYHPFISSIDNMKSFTENILETNCGVNLRYIFPLDDNLIFNYKIDTTNDTFENIVNLLQNKNMKNKIVLPKSITKRFTHYGKMKQIKETKRQGDGGSDDGTKQSKRPRI